MRIARLLGSVLVPAALLTAGCASSAEKVDGAAAPITASPAPSATSALPPTVSASPTATATTVEPAEPTATAITTKTPAARLVLGPKGFGALQLGMSSTKATNTKLIVAWKGQGGDCGLRSHLKAANGVEAGSDGIVLSGDTSGVQVIDAYGSVRTPQGIHLGSTTAAMRKAYPDWTNATEEDPAAEGRGYAAVPGNSKATYRIETLGGKVIQLTLQLKTQACYE